MQSTQSPTLRLEALRHRRSMGDWLELRIVALPRAAERTNPVLAPAAGSASAAEIEAKLEMAQLHCAVIGGVLTVSRDGNGALWFTIEIPTAPVEMTMSATEEDAPITANAA